MLLFDEISFNLNQRMFVLNQTIVVGTYFLRYILVEKLDIRLNNTFIKSFLTSACIGAIIKRKTCDFFVKKPVNKYRNTREPGDIAKGRSHLGGYLMPLHIIDQPASTIQLELI